MTCFPLQISCVVLLGVMLVGCQSGPDPIHPLPTEEADRKPQAAVENASLSLPYCLEFVNEFERLLYEEKKVRAEWMSDNSEKVKTYGTCYLTFSEEFRINSLKEVNAASSEKEEFVRDRIVRMKARVKTLTYENKKLKELVEGNGIEREATLDGTGRFQFIPKR